jgi:TRAP-type C4-dicarboxylate transport system substrate-binding protein
MTMSLHGNRRLRSSAIAVAILAASVLGTQARAEQWQAYTYWGSPTVVAAVGFKKLTEDIQTLSDGALTIKFNLGGSLSIAASNINSAVSDDIVQIADDAYYQGAIPSGGLLQLPFLIRDIAEVNKVVGILRPTIERDYAKRGVTVLGYYAYPPQVFWSRGAVTSLAQISGKKYRVSSPEQGDFIKAFGGLPVTLGSADVPAALERGVVDGVLTASAGGVLAWKELLKSSYHIGVNFPVAWIIANTDRFKALSPDLQAKIHETVQQDLDKLTVDLQSDDASITQRLSGEGVTITPASEADEAAAREKMTSAWESWAKARGPESVDLLKQVRAALGR